MLARTPLRCVCVCRTHGNYLDAPGLMEFIQEPGDTLHIPAFWGHAVLNLEDTVAVAYEFNPGYCQLSHFTTQEFEAMSI